MRFRPLFGSGMLRERYLLRAQAQTEMGHFALSLGLWLRTPVGLFHVLDAVASPGAGVAYRKQNAFRPSRLSARREVVARIPTLLGHPLLSKREMLYLAPFLTEVERFEQHVRQVELPKILGRTPA